MFNRCAYLKFSNLLGVKNWTRPVMSGRGGVGVRRDSATRATSSLPSCGFRASKGTRRSGNQAFPKISPGSRSWYSVKGVVCRPEETKRFEEFDLS